MSQQTGTTSTATTKKKSPTWKITEYGCVVGRLHGESFACIRLDSFYLPEVNTEEDVWHLLWACAAEDLDTKLTFRKLTNLVKKHFNLGTVAKMHLWEAHA